MGGGGFHLLLLPHWPAWIVMISLRHVRLLPVATQARYYIPGHTGGLDGD